MPLLPLPSGDSSLPGGDVPVSDESDVLAEFPARIRKVAVAPVRDAFAAAFAEGFKFYQNVAPYAAAQCDPTRATGDNLRAFAEEHSVVPLSNESEQSVRDRLFEAPAIVTPNAIVDGINAILAPYTPIKCHLSELELDGLFVHDDGASVWDSFIGAEPNYPDRYYPEVPSLLPGGAVPGGLPRSFFVRIPPLELNDISIPYVVTDADDGVFVSDIDDDDALWLFVDPQLAEELYLEIVRFVERVKGQGISWSLLVDPDLT